MRLGSICTTVVLCLCVFAQTECPMEDLNNDTTTDSQEPQSPPETPPLASPEPIVDGDDSATPIEPWQGTGCPILINEVMAHSDDESPDWIELYNSAGIPVAIGGWLLSDREDDLRKFQIPANTVVEPFSYIVFYENTDFANPANPGTLAPFALSENGETLCLYSGEDPNFPDYLLQETLGASETNWSLGRHPTSDGGYRFTTMSQVTPGAANAYPLVGPVIINEIMYDPADDPDAEYVELLNISTGPVTLFDGAAMEPWRFIDDSGLELRFPTDSPVTMAPNEHLLLIRRTAALRDTVPAAVRMFEWGSGKLGNKNETLILFKPGDVDEEGTRYWVEVDRVDYSDGSHGEDFPNNIDPWPIVEDGSNFSLSRIFPGRFGNDPNNWRATTPTPGSTNN